MKKAFHETTWADVKAGDTVLVAHGDEIAQVTVKKVSLQTGAGGETVSVCYTCRYAKYWVKFDPGNTAYIQSRL